MINLVINSLIFTTINNLEATKTFEVDDVTFLIEPWNLIRSSTSVNGEWWPKVDTRRQYPDTGEKQEGQE